LLNDSVEVFVKDKAGFVDVSCLVTLGTVDEEILSPKEEEENKGVTPPAPSATYSGRFYFEGVPEEEELRDVIEGHTDGERLTGKDVTFHIKVSSCLVSACSVL
jgi:hypothetical protein